IRGAVAFGVRGSADRHAGAARRFRAPVDGRRGTDRRSRGTVRISPLLPRAPVHAGPSGGGASDGGPRAVAEGPARLAPAGRPRRNPWHFIGRRDAASSAALTGPAAPRNLAADALATPLSGGRGERRDRGARFPGART